MHYYDGHFGGMHLIWWIIWVILLAWIFFIPADIPYQKTKKDLIYSKRFNECFHGLHLIMAPCALVGVCCLYSAVALTRPIHQASPR